MPHKRAFVALQDRFVRSLTVACCPTMDLVAVLTLDHHLVVYRTTSWQKLLHIKSSDVSFKMVTLAWKPDGLQLAVGCDEGSVAVYEIESGDILPERRSKFRHEHCIIAMHWTQITDTGSSDDSPGDKQRRRKFSENARTSCNVVSQSKLWFQRRASRYLAGDQYATSPNTLLVTADTGGFIALWWMGRVLLTRIDVRTKFSAEEFEILESMEQQEGDTRGFCIEQVKVAPDLSLVFVLLVFFDGSNSRVDNAMAGKHMKLYRMLTLEMATMEHIHEDIALVASTVDCVHVLLDRIGTYGKQMSCEWTNATRIFELKMGLMGSLYEKYACKDTPQEDMLSVLVTGITPPALAQYFAQDIQEMSVHRMQKAFFSGCGSLRTLVEDKLKHDLVKVLFLLSELRGHAKWNAANYATTLGISVRTLDDLIQATQDAIVEVEILLLALSETVQDFALLFQWILERIRIHTNSNRLGAETSAAAVAGRGASSASDSKSLLNLRRLCDFLQRAAEAAKRFRQRQPNHSMYKVETTFGNLVSLQLSAQSLSSTEKSGGGCLALVKCIQDQWLVLLNAVAVTLAQTTQREKSGCFTVGSTNNVVEECQIHFRQPFRTPGLEETVEDDEQSDEESDEETIDWNSLKHYGHTRYDQADCSTMLVGLRLQSGVLLLLRAFQRVDTRRLQNESISRLTWDAAVLNFLHGSPMSDVDCRGFAFYGDKSSGKQEQLAFVLDRAVDGQMQEWLYLQSYDKVEFSHINPTVPFEEVLAQSTTHTFTLDHSQGRAIASSSIPPQSGKKVISVIATASRGVLCVILPPNRLTIFDAEDSEDDDNEDDEDVVDG